MKERGAAVLKVGTEDETWGICEDISRKPVPEEEKVQDGENKVVGLIFTNEDAVEVTANFKPLAAAGESDPPMLTEANLIGEDLLVTFDDGDTLTIIVQDAEKKYTKGKPMTFMIKGTAYPGVAAAEA